MVCKVDRGGWVLVVPIVAGPGLAIEKYLGKEGDRGGR